MGGVLPAGTVQLVLALAAPFALPKGISLGSRLLHSILNPSPKGTRTPLQPSTNPTLRPPLVPQDSASTALWRVLLVSLSLSLTVYAILLPPHNLFLSLSMPRNIFERVLPALRSPLDIRTATESLARAWSVRLGGRALANDEISLLNRLQTLDARLIYVAYGTSPVMSCTWCRPGANWDYLVLIAPGVTLEYLLVLAVVGALLNRHRKHWRRWAVAVLLVGGAIEAALRLNWQGSRGGAVVMIHSILHLYRHALFSATIVVAYFLPPKPIPQHPSASHLIAPVLSDLTSRAELVLNKLRVAKVQRMVVMQDAQTCNTARDFWSRASVESKLAHSDPTVRKWLKNVGEHTSETARSIVSFKDLTESAFVFKSPPPFNAAEDLTSNSQS